MCRLLLACPLADTFKKPAVQIRAPTNKLNRTESDLKDFEDALEKHRAKGAEDQEVERKVQKSRRRAPTAKAAAAAPARRNNARRARVQQSETPPSSPER